MSNPTDNQPQNEPIILFPKTDLAEPQPFRRLTLAQDVAEGVIGFAQALEQLDCLERAVKSLEGDGFHNYYEFHFAEVMDEILSERCAIVLQFSNSWGERLRKQQEEAYQEARAKLEKFLGEAQ